jgi:hypothetical protein
MCTLKLAADRDVATPPSATNNNPLRFHFVHLVVFATLAVATFLYYEFPIYCNFCQIFERSNMVRGWYFGQFHGHEGS